MRDFKIALGRLVALAVFGPRGDGLLIASDPVPAGIPAVRRTTTSSHRPAPGENGRRGDHQHRSPPGRLNLHI